MKLPLVALGFFPFAFGGFINWLIVTYPNLVVPSTFWGIGLILLLIWGSIAFLAKSSIKSSQEVVLCLNAAEAVVLILIGVQELIRHTYWFNFLGIWSQFFYLPVLNLGFTLTSWSASSFPAYCASFWLMVAASATGCKLRKN